MRTHFYLLISHLQKNHKDGIARQDDDKDILFSWDTSLTKLVTKDF